MHHCSIYPLSPLPCRRWRATHVSVSPILTSNVNIQHHISEYSSTSFTSSRTVEVKGASVPVHKAVSTLTTQSEDTASVFEIISGTVTIDTISFVFSSVFHHRYTTLHIYRWCIPNGAAILVSVSDSTHTFSITNTFFTSCTALNGSAVYFTFDLSVITALKDLLFNKCSTSEDRGGISATVAARCI